jgi:endoglucanase
VPAAEMAGRLSAAGVAMARGFSLNVSNFRTTDEELRYGQELPPQVGWKPFVVDTGRNGKGASLTDVWCNPSGRALVPVPQAAPTRLVDGYLWVKPPGESDGTCRTGQPPAGVFWPQYADELAAAAGW